MLCNRCGKEFKCSMKKYDNCRFTRVCVCPSCIILSYTPYIHDIPKSYIKYIIDDNKQCESDNDNIEALLILYLI